METTIILLTVYTPLGNQLLGIAPIETEVWLLAIPFCLAVLMLDELQKVLLRNSDR